MLNIVSFLLDLIDQHIIWLYAACLCVILLYVRSYSLARRDRLNTIFTIEKEVAAHRENQAMSGIGALLGVALVITVVKIYLVPTINLSAVAAVTPTPPLVVPTRMPTVAMSTPSPQPTVVIPTPRPSYTPQPTPTWAPATPVGYAPSACGDANVRLTSPRENATVSGRVGIVGTANSSNFQFYKVEYAAGERPAGWNVIHDVHRSAIVNGLLEELDTTTLPDGVYWIQLTVVDRTGNFPPPCQVRIVVQN